VPLCPFFVAAPASLPSILPINIEGESTKARQKKNKRGDKEKKEKRKGGRSPRRRTRAIVNICRFENFE